MNKLPNMKLYRECQQCHSLTSGKHDAYCPLCGCKLKDSEEQLAGIRDYAKSLLILYLTNSPKQAKEVHINEIPAYATGEIQNKRMVIFDQTATRRALAECWNEIEPVLEDYCLDNRDEDFSKFCIEDLHVYSILWHAEAEWQEITEDFDVCEDHLNHKTLAKAIERLKSY